MKTLLIAMLLASVVSLCNLTEGLTNRSREQGGPSISNSGSKQASENNSNANTPPAPPSPPSKTTSEVSGGPVAGGELAGKAITLPKPTYPPIARAAKASGTVVIDVVVDETGKVTSATAQSGHPLLRASAVQAALAARFTPTLKDGKPVQATGTITYEFKL